MAGVPSRNTGVAEGHVPVVVMSVHQWILSAKKSQHAHMFTMEEGRVLCEFESEVIGRR